MADVLIEKEKFYYSVKLNRPDKRNALTPEMVKTLTEFFSNADKDKFARGVVLTGAGTSFCAGADLNWMKASANLKLKENQADAKMLFEMYEAARECTLPIIGMVHGAVFGGGLGLVAICDVAIAEINTMFCFSETRLGLVPAVISSFVTAKMAPNKVKELMITARAFTAEEAAHAGLVEFAGRELEAQNYLTETLRLLGHNGPEAVRDVKKLLSYIHGADPKDVKTHSIEVIAARRVSDEGQEGTKCFLEHRAAAWVVEDTVEEDE